jgi:hypothetical protein
VKLTVRPDGYEVDTGRSHPLVPITATVAALAMGAVGFLGGGGLAVFGSIGGATGSQGGAEAPGAPNAPTFVAVVPTDNSALVTASDFAGSGADTQDSAAWRIRRTSDDAVVFADTVGDSLTAWRGAGLGASVPLQTDTSYYVDHAHKGAAGGWSAFSPADTFEATAGGDGLAYLPAGWALVSDEPMNDTAFVTGDGFQSETVGNFLVTDETASGVCAGSGSGGRLSGFSIADRVLDSIDAAGMRSPPWVWAMTYPPGLGGGGCIKFRIDPEDGNGPAAATPLQDVFYLITECWEGASSGCGVGISDFTLNNGGTKGHFPNNFGSRELWDYLSGVWLFGDKIDDPVTGCKFLLANLMGADTMPYPNFSLTGAPGCSNAGRHTIERGQWVKDWFCISVTDSIVSFGRNDEIRGAHYPVDFSGSSWASGISQIVTSGTWGGGGNKSGTHDRLTDDIQIYARDGAGTTCPTSAL